MLLDTVQRGANQQLAAGISVSWWTPLKTPRETNLKYENLHLLSVLFSGTSFRIAAEEDRLAVEHAQREFVKVPAQPELSTV